MSVKKKKKLKKRSGRTTKKETIKYEIERIDWKDHTTRSSTWTDPEYVIHRPLMCVSVGIRVKEDREGVTLAQNMGTNMLVADTVYILKNCITHRMKLGTVEYDKD